jgi:hypothetical protein
MMPRPMLNREDWHTHEVVEFFKDNPGGFKSDPRFKQLIRRWGDTGRITNMHVERLLSLVKASCPGAAPDLERVISAGTLTQWRRAHLASGGHDQNVTRIADLVQVGVPLVAAASNNSKQGKKRRPALDYSNSVVNRERTRAANLNIKMTQGQINALRGEAARAFKYLPENEKSRWEAACEIKRRPIVVEEVPSMDSWDKDCLWGLASRESFIAESEVEQFMKEEFGKLVGVSCYAPKFRDEWRGKTIIKDEGRRT